MNNYQDYLDLVLSKESHQLPPCKEALLYNSINLNLSINKNSMQDIKNDAENLCISIARTINRYIKTSDDLIVELTKAWWTTQFTITTPQDEMVMINQYIQQFYKLLSSDPLPANFVSESRRLAIHINLCLASLLLVSNINPTQVLYNSLEK